MCAFSQFRCTVRSETPRIAAISANEKPQKDFKSTISASECSVLASSSNASPMRLSSRSSTTFSTVSALTEVIWNSPPRFWAFRLRA